jgi:uracil-DNA glycosylase
VGVCDPGESRRLEIQTATEVAEPGLSSTNTLLKIREQVVDCRRCPRLVQYREQVARDKRREFLEWNYWGRPVPGFGDSGAYLLIVGLAPAANGGNRTGRVFTGDRSGDFLYKCLYKMGFANQPVSRSIDDGLKLNGAYVTAAVKCAPPDNKPSPVETSSCSSYLAAEIDALARLTTILCLGQFAFNAVMKTIRNKYKITQKTLGFAHGRILRLGEGVPLIVCSYHPSPRNTQTGKLTEKMFLSVLRKLSETNANSSI